MKIQHACLLALSASFAISIPVSAEPTKTEAVITKVEGSTITARTTSGPLTVMLTPSTDIAQTSGLASKKARDAKSLIPGLIFTVDGDLQGQTLTAEHIRFKEKDWRTAVATKAGTAEQFSELRKAIIEGQEYVIRDEVAVYFPTGNAVVGATYKQKLREMAEKAPSEMMAFQPAMEIPNSDHWIWSQRTSGTIISWSRLSAPPAVQVVTPSHQPISTPAW